MKYFLGLLILIAPGCLHGQNFILPSLAADSAYFEVVQGRKCEKVAAGLTRENAWLDSLRMTLDEQVYLQQSIIESQNAIISDWPKELAKHQQVFEAERQGLKGQISSLRKWLIGLVGFDVAVILIVLLL